MEASDLALRELFARHPRRWAAYRYVYPVISRRSRGLSIGLNLNVDQRCNFDCIYCCVDRSTPLPRQETDLTLLGRELDELLSAAVSGAIWADPAFVTVPSALRRINDIAFSGDGEPTADPRFDQACQLVADVKRKHHLAGVKIVLITNATLLDKPHVKRGLALLDANQGEIWAKLDAGTQTYFALVNRTRVKLDTVLKRIAAAGNARPLVIQAMFMQVRGKPVPEAEFHAWLERIADLLAAGCQIRRVQIYTIARATAESFVAPLTDEQVDHLAEVFTQRFPALPVEAFYGA